MKGCNRQDLTPTEERRKELDIPNMNERITEYSEKWKGPVSKISDDFHLKIMKYVLSRRHDVRNPQKRGRYF